MIPEVKVGLDALALATGFAFVLWGVRIYRLWIALMGFAGAAAAGVAIATFTAGTTEAMIVSGLAAGLLGALIAWPLHKLAAAVVAGLACAAIGVLAAQTWVGDNAFVPIGIASFVIGGIIAFRWFERAVQLAIAFTGAQAVFLAVFAPAGLLVGDPAGLPQRLLDVHTQNLAAFFANTVMFMTLGYWIHSGRVRAKQGRGSATDGYGRCLAVRFAGLILLAWVGAALLAIRFDWGLSSFELLGMHPLSWPIVTLAAVVAGGMQRPRVVHADAPRVRGRWVAPLVFSTLAMPILTAALFVAYGAPLDALSDFYRAFMGGTAGSIAAKCGVSLALLPFVMVGAARRAERRYGGVAPSVPATASGRAGPAPAAAGDQSVSRPIPSADLDATSPGTPAPSAEWLSSTQPVGARTVESNARRPQTQPRTWTSAKD